LITRLLEGAWTYKVSQSLWYRTGQQQRYVREYVRPCAGDRILDIGCGPAVLLQYMPRVDYLGFDPNADYIRDARRSFGDRGRFECGYLKSLEDVGPGSFDIVMANGVLHHLSDAEASELVSLASQALKPGGRMVTRDGCYEEGQSPLVRLLLENDRGHHVRALPAYEQLLKARFEIRKAEIRHDMLRLPYSLLIFECEKTR
jgi:SAM-dependent methyltransferase